MIRIRFRERQGGREALERRENGGGHFVGAFGDVSSDAISLNKRPKCLCKVFLFTQTMDQSEVFFIYTRLVHILVAVTARKVVNHGLSVMRSLSLTKLSHASRLGCRQWVYRR